MTIISGQLTLLGRGAARDVFAIAVDSDEIVADTVSATNGVYQLDLGTFTGRILVIATDVVGMPFAALANLDPDAAVFPGVWNGFVYESEFGGQLGTSDPLWPLTDGANISSGSVTLTARRYRAPVAVGELEVA